MKVKTGEFEKIEKTIRVCDSCRIPLGLDYINFDFRWDDGYDHYGDEIEVCSMKCLLTELNSYGSVDYPFPGGESVTLMMPSKMMKDLLIKNDTESK